MSELSRIHSIERELFCAVKRGCSVGELWLVWVDLTESFFTEEYNEKRRKLGVYCKER